MNMYCTFVIGRLDTSSDIPLQYCFTACFVLSICYKNLDDWHRLTPLIVIEDTIRVNPMSPDDEHQWWVVPGIRGTRQQELHPHK